MSDKFELKEGQGSLWHESNCKVVRKGKVKIDGEERYSAILKYTHSDGSEKYELVFSAGLLYLNPEDEKQNENSPDLKGSIIFSDTVYRFGGWRNVKDNGEEWTSVRLTPKDDSNYSSNNEEKEEQDESQAPF